MPDPLASHGDDASVRSVKRALAILRAFERSERSLKLGEIARRAGLDKATTRRLLRTLIGEELVEQPVPGGDYALTLGVLALLAGRNPADLLRRRALPLLAEVAASAAAAYLVVPHLGSALCVEAVEGERPLPRPWAVGDLRPLNACATTRVLMAYLPLERRLAALAQPLPAMTPATPTDPFLLSGLLDTIRQRGWETGVDDVSAGFAGLGVPVRHSGGVIAAIGIAGRQEDVLQGDRPRHLDTLRAKVRELERRLDA